MQIVTVIVPVFNTEKYISRCVNSILAQTFTNFDLVLVDDGSTDNCGNICDEYAAKDDRIIVIHKPNGGLSSARNAGIEWSFSNSSSKWVTFIDSDDWIHKQYLWGLIHATEVSGVNISACRHKSVASFHSDTKNSLIEAFDQIEIEHFYCSNWHESISACGKLFWKEDFLSIRFPLGKKYEDAFTTHKILFNYSKIAYIKEPLYYYYKNENGITGNSNKRKWDLQRLDEVDAFHEQMVFFDKNHLTKAYYEGMYRFLSVCGPAVYYLKLLFPREKSIYISYKKLLKIYIRKYKKKIYFSDSRVNKELSLLIKIHNAKCSVFLSLKRKIRHVKDYCCSIIKK